MDSKKAQKYLYKQLLNSFKEDKWKLLSPRDEVNLNGKVVTINSIFHGHDSRLVNTELNLFFKRVMSEYSLKEFLYTHSRSLRNKKLKEYFKFDIIKQDTFFGYWFEMDDSKIRGGVRSSIGHSDLYLDLNFIQRFKLKRNFKSMMERLYDRKFKKSFAHSTDIYMERNKSIFRGLRLEQILGESEEEEGVK